MTCLPDQHGGWAKLIGSGKGKNRHKRAERAVRRVCDAGLMVQESRGSERSKDSNEYRLLPLTRLDLERAKGILGRPLTKGGRAYERDRRSPLALNEWDRRSPLNRNRRGYSLQTENLIRRP